MLCGWHWAGDEREGKRMRRWQPASPWPCDDARNEPALSRSWIAGAGCGWVVAGGVPSPVPLQLRRVGRKSEAIGRIASLLLQHVVGRVC